MVGGQTTTLTGSERCTIIGCQILGYPPISIKHSGHVTTNKCQVSKAYGCDVIGHAHLGNFFSINAIEISTY